MRLDHALMLAGVVCILAAVFACGWFWALHVHKPVTVAVLETPAHPVDHGDGSSTMARVVDRKPETPAPKTPKGKPAGAIEMTVIPDAPVDGKCAPITMHLALTESEDGGLRVSERVENGETAEAVHYAPPMRYVVTERKFGIGLEHRDGETSALVERYWPGARAGLTIGDKSVGVSAVFRF